VFSPPQAKNSSHNTGYTVRFGSSLNMMDVAKALPNAAHFDILRRSDTSYSLKRYTQFKKYFSFNKVF